MQHSAHYAVTLENLEKRVLFAQISVADFGAIPNDGHDDHAAVTAAMRASSPGDTIAFDAGQYDLSSHLQLRGDRAYIGAGTLNTRLQFHVGHDGWGMKPEPDAQNITIENFHFDGGGIALGDGSFFKNITIRNNEFTNPAPGTYYNNGPAIFAGIRSDGLNIIGNHIHDSGKYGLVLFSVDRLNLLNNTLENLSQGAHILDPGKDNNISFNRLSGLVRMGFEIQRHGQRVAENLTVEGNVITDWRRPYRDSFGLSIVPDGSVNTRVVNNYIQGVPSGWDGQWHDQANSEANGRRMGYGIEYGARSGEISGNVIGGAFANHIIISGGGGLHDSVIDVKNNRFFGKPVWHDWITTESHGGAGFGWRGENNQNNDNFDAMPKAPSARKGPASQPPPNKTNDDVVPADNGKNNRTSLDNDDPHHGPLPASERLENFIWLTDLTWESASNGWGPVEIDRANGERAAGDGPEMRIRGRDYERGLGVAINSEISYNLDEGFDTFLTHIGIDDYTEGAGSVTFEVWADGNKIYDSGIVTGTMAGRALEIDVRNVKTLTLVTTDGGDGGRKDHANWAGAKLIPVRSNNTEA